jgi:hypothetical protein
VAFDSQSVKDSWLEKRITKGSCVPILDSGSQPKAIMCLSLSETKTWVAIVGAFTELVNVFNSTALVLKPFVLSQ